jgi:HAD superfamily hydrolase (TIGR01484 family)
MSRPITDLRGPVRALFTDIDGTLTTDDRLEASTYAALERLHDSGVPIVLVTGRPAGFAQALMKLTPAVAAVSENGGLTFIRDGRKLDKVYGVPEPTVLEWRRRMATAVAEAVALVPGARLSSDSHYREVDLAIDWNEEVALSRADADKVVDIVRRAGFAATRSSVHVNFGPPHFDKLSACKVVVERVLHGDPNELAGYIYVGDALNDAPMFAGFPSSVGVANVRSCWDELDHKPAYVTERAEGAGVRELVDHLLTLPRSR